MLRLFFCLLLLLLSTPLSAQEAGLAERLAPALDAAEALVPLETVTIAVAGEIVAERGYNGHSVTAPTNIKSASKTVISALVGIAISRGLLEGVDQPIAPLLADRLPEIPDPRIEEITLEHLLTMRAGLEPTSGRNYGRWVASSNWVRAALAQPFADDPGERWLYSTGSTHLLSAILTEVSGQSTLALAHDWLGAIEGFAIAGWSRDPQGIYLGGNEMAMTPRALLAFGEVYRNGGRAQNGDAVVPEEWIARSWMPHTRSTLAGDAYGYGWFLRDFDGHAASYAWGFGGQMLYIVPTLALSVVMTSDEFSPAAATGHRDDLHDLMAAIVAAVAEERPEPTASP